MVEHQPFKLWVLGSSPSGITKSIFGSSNALFSSKDRAKFLIRIL